MITRTTDESGNFRTDIEAKKESTKQMVGLAIRPGQTKEGVNMTIHKHDISGKTAQSENIIEPIGASWKRRKILRMKNV